MVCASTLRNYNLAALIVPFLRNNKKKGNRNGQKAFERTRQSVHDVYYQQGDYYFRRAHRMSFQSFWQLYQLLKDGIEMAHSRDKAARRKPQRGKPRNRSPHVPNGRIHTSVRLAVALRYFAGGSFYDLAPLYGVGTTDATNSVWYVVEAINRHPLFAINYPSDHEIQREIASQFEEKSQAEFKCCAGAVDGVLIWIHRPTDKDCKLSTCDSGKFFCSRKHKFGLNCQAVSDCRGRILDVSIRYPGSGSDLLAFEGSKLFQNLETEGFLAPGLCLFGDNAYVNTPYMATPFPNTSGGPKDWYNFFHSQLRIRVECSFGILSQRWGILRAALPKGISLRKSVRLVTALAKLHNFCIGQTIEPSLGKDENNIKRSHLGSVPMEPVQGTGEMGPRQLIGGGHHFDDYTRHCRNLLHSYKTVLPRESMLGHIVKEGYRRPQAIPRRH